MEKELIFDQVVGPQRVFLGWDEPLVAKVVDYLWARRLHLPSMLVVVPTAQSGRRLREMLAERGGCLAPTVVTSSFFFRSEEASNGMLAEYITWEQVLKQVDWAEYEDIIPSGSTAEEDVVKGLIQQVQTIRSELADAEHDIARVAARLPQEHAEKARWMALARLEKDYRRAIKKLGFPDPQDAKRRAAQECHVPQGIETLVLAGVPDPAPLALCVWQRWLPAINVEVLIHAPADEAHGFDEWGCPLVDIWTQRVIDVGGNDVIEICENPVDQAKAAVREIAGKLSGEEKVGRDDLALGVCDSAILPEMKRVFAERGWTLFDPSGKTLGETGFLSWLESLCQWMEKDDVRTLSRLLPQAWMEKLLERKTYWLTHRLARVVEAALPQTSSDLLALENCDWLSDQRTRDKEVKEAAAELAGVCNSLNYWKNRFSYVGVAETLREMFIKVLADEPELIAAATPFLNEVEQLEKAVRLTPGRWISILARVLSHVNIDTETGGDSLDAQGWLELGYESAPTLVICGFNDGVIPESIFGDAWLSNSMRSLLGLKDNRKRFARDAFYTVSLVESRKTHGSVKFIAGRWTSDGESLKPSRLLLMPPREQLAGRVLFAFSAPEVIRPVLAWQRDWLLSVPNEEPRLALTPTGISTYLKCPFRYYLKHILHMQRPEQLREEWSQREFGTVIHEVLERFGHDKEAREFTKSSLISAWFSKELDVVVAERFTTQVPLAVELQVESMRQRLGFFAREQADRRKEGWEIKEVEKPFKLSFADMELKGTIDRIDYHAERDEWMVWDYKTGRDAADPKKAHCSPLDARHPCPDHLEGKDAFQMMALAAKNRKKPSAHIWTNLQLPLYAAWLWQEMKVQSGVGYISMMSSKHEVGFRQWENYDVSYTDAALLAASEIAVMIKSGVFWPPAEKVKYDDYEELLDESLFEDAVKYKGGLGV